MQIRDAEPMDVEPLARLWKAGWHDGLLPEDLARLRTVESFRDRLRAGLAQLRAVGPPGAPIGFSFLKNDELYQLFVAPESRGRGVAAALMADAERRLAAAGHAVAWLSCVIGNHRAARFYEKSGWRRVGVEPLEVETSKGRYPIEVWRYEKALA